MLLRNEADIGADIQASQAAPYRAEDTTYRELLNAGDVGLIRNEKAARCAGQVHGVN